MSESEEVVSCYERRAATETKQTSNKSKERLTHLKTCHTHQTQTNRRHSFEIAQSKFASRLILLSKRDKFQMTRETRRLPERRMGPQKNTQRERERTHAHPHIL